MNVCNRTNARVLNAVSHNINGTPVGRSVNQNDGLNGPSLATFTYEDESGKKEEILFSNPDREHELNRATLQMSEQ